MSEPKYAVGEVVIVSCRDYPKFNGEHTVKEILMKRSVYFDRLYGGNLRSMPPRTASPYGYIMEDILDDDDGCEVVYDEMCLRKKHQPGELSFDQLVNEDKALV